MPFCRKSEDSDVTLTVSNKGILCMGCKLNGDKDAFPADSGAHLNEHREAGHKVPDGTSEKLAEHMQVMAAAAPVPAPEPEPDQGGEG